ncbi:uncharacterized protein [Anabrus simplex]|uniref:uncharacterized protein isoform X2 n=1 Tax=Anabrus simplex TaxID=316456 RepID=UPI0035A2FCE1
MKVTKAVAKPKAVQKKRKALLRQSITKICSELEALIQMPEKDTARIKALRDVLETKYRELRETVGQPATPASPKKNAVPSNTKKKKILKSTGSSLLQAKLDFISLQGKILKQQDRRHRVEHKAHLAEHRIRMRLLRLRFMAVKKRHFLCTPTHC